MPIIPKYKHPLRRVREALGLQQKELADRLGVSKFTIRAIENAQLEISPELGRKIYFETGALPESLVVTLKGRPGYSKKAIGATIPRGADRKNYTGKATPATSRDTEENVLADIFDARNFVDVILQAAAENGHFGAVMLSFLNWVETSEAEFGLRQAAEKKCREYLPPSERILALRAGAHSDEVNREIEHFEKMKWFKLEGWPDKPGRSWLASDQLRMKLILERDSSAHGRKKISPTAKSRNRPSRRPA